MFALLLLACTGADPTVVNDSATTDADADGYTLADGDCADDDAAVNPGATEKANDLDDDCDGVVDDGTVRFDDDGDGYTEKDGDCDDTRNTVHPGADEVWYDGVDSDCSGGSDDDQDGDGHAASGFGGDDCDDTDPTAYPGADDVPYDGVDSDCLGDDDFDADGDGYGLDDCDDADAAVHPGAREVCDGHDDEDCDGEVDEAAEVLGDARACAADSCLAIRLAREGAPDGTYWINPGSGTMDVTCDMTNDTGGWTLVGSFRWPGTTAGVPGWTSGTAVGSTTSDITQTFKLSDADINALVQYRYRAHGTASTCVNGPCTVDTTLYWAGDCVYDSGHSSTGTCTAAYRTYDLEGYTELSSPCSWHYGLTSAVCGVTSQFGTSHDGDHVFVGLIDGSYTHAYDGRAGEDPSIEVWVR